MPESPKPEETRRTFLARALRLLLGLPLVGFAVAVISPLTRILRPTLRPYNLNQEPDKPAGAQQQVATTANFPREWSMYEFTFFQKNFEYTPRAENTSLVPGFGVRIGQDVVDSVKTKAPELYKILTDNDNINVMMFSRICPHLGCIFNYFSVNDPRGADWYPDKVRSDYGFPGAKLDQSYFACPCHFSVYDLRQVSTDLVGKMKLGKVVSGPAPQPPHLLSFEKRGEEFWITGMEAGGVS